LNYSIAICAYNEETHIGRLLEGDQRQTVAGVEVILVDSGSTDATVSVAKQYGHDAILGHISGLPPDSRMELAVTSNFLLSAPIG